MKKANHNAFSYKIGWRYFKMEQICCNKIIYLLQTKVMNKFNSTKILTSSKLNWSNKRCKITIQEVDKVNLITIMKIKLIIKISRVHSFLKISSKKWWTEEFSSQTNLQSAIWIKLRKFTWQKLIKFHPLNLSPKNSNCKSCKTNQVS